MVILDNELMNNSYPYDVAAPGTVMSTDFGCSSALLLVAVVMATAQVVTGFSSNTLLTDFWIRFHTGMTLQNVCSH